MARLITPPVAVILIRSAPFLYRCLTAFLASSTEFTTPSFGPGSPISEFLYPFVGSPWPPVEARPFPAVKILGPITVPLFIASLRAIFTPDPPTSLTVVKPAISVFLATTVDLNATSASLSWNLLIYLSWPPDSLSICTWKSIKPGIKVFDFKSIILISSDSGSINPFLIEVILLPSIITVLFSITFPDFESNIFPAWIYISWLYRLEEQIIKSVRIFFISKFYICNVEKLFLIIVEKLLNWVTNKINLRFR